MKIFIIVLILIVDIFSKRLVINFMFPDMSINILSNFFSITYAKNMGVAFSFLDGHVNFIIVASLIIIFILIKYVKDNVNNKLEEFGYSFIIGGALGNLLDRIFYGYVVDFLDFNIFGYDYPIFNFADTFIVVGVFILIVCSIRENGDKDGNFSRKK